MWLACDEQKQQNRAEVGSPPALAYKQERAYKAPLGGKKHPDPFL